MADDLTIKVNVDPSAATTLKQIHQSILGIMKIQAPTNGGGGSAVLLPQQMSNGFKQMAQQANTAMKPMGNLWVPLTVGGKQAQEQISKVTQKVKEQAVALRDTGEAASIAHKRLMLLTGVTSTLGIGGGIMGGPGGATFAGVQRLGFAGFLASHSGMSGLKAGVMVGIGLLAAGTVNFAKAAADAGMQFEESMTRVSLAADMGGKGIEGLQQKVLGLSRATKVFNVDEVSSAVEQLVKAGRSMDQVFGKEAKVALQFGYISEIGTAQATQFLVNVANQFSSTVDKVSDTMIRVADVSTASIQQVSETFADAAFSAKSLGLEMSQFGALTTMMANMGLRGAEAANAFRRSAVSFEEMKAGFATATQQRVFERLGMSRMIKDIQSGRVGYINLLRELKRVGATIGDLSGMFDIFGAKAVAALLPQLDLYEKLSAEISGATGATEQYAKALENTLSGSFKELDASWSRFWNKVGPLVAGALKAPVDFFNTLLNGIPAPGSRSGVQQFSITSDSLLTYAKTATVIAEELKQEKTGTLNSTLAAGLPEGSLLVKAIDEMVPIVARIIENAKALENLGIARAGEIGKLPEGFIRQVRGFFPGAEGYNGVGDWAALERFYQNLAIPLSTITESMAQDILKQIAHQLEAGAATYLRELYPHDNALESSKRVTELMQFNYALDNLQRQTLNTRSAIAQATPEWTRAMQHQEVRAIQEKIKQDSKTIWDKIGEFLSEWSREMSTSLITGVQAAAEASITAGQGFGSALQGMTQAGITSLAQSLFGPDGAMRAVITAILGADTGNPFVAILSSLLSGIFVDAANALVDTFAKAIMQWLGIETSSQATRRFQHESTGGWALQSTGAGVAPLGPVSVGPGNQSWSIQIDQIMVGGGGGAGGDHEAVAVAIRRELEDMVRRIGRDGRRTMNMRAEGREIYRGWA